MSETWVVVGLGNPGAKYEATRHNIGQLAVDELASQIGSRFQVHKTNNRVAEGWLRPGGPKLILVKPNSFMNLSGGPVSQILSFYGLEVDRLIVLHDELDIPFDSVKLKNGGGHGGHNGLRSIAASLKTPDFTRVRIGIGRPPGSGDPAAFVLTPFNKTEQAALPLLVSDAADAAVAVIEEGLTAAQQRFHGRVK
ncbi:aminoacyl-tRNA hydrolase [Leucobacter sp. OH1287]|uniref:aminoacyl-tRNA hydrolase n=1 Tax=Leucobacter sp. OH1287 TaxID=2491049 RepID=UPI000F5F26A9|nr:aminoacyl-tRNA hydrolase [Leucobacter sp. OH1287]RRD60516.1 aminoacyl-tRNA hydrolase [Leucobacter sp. OH1287]